MLPNVAAIHPDLLFLSTRSSYERHVFHILPDYYNLSQYRGVQVTIQISSKDYLAAQLAAHVLWLETEMLRPK
jgi:hypothetical protein